MRKRLSKLLKSAKKAAQSLLGRAGKLASKALKRVRSIELGRKSKIAIAAVLILAVAGGGYQAAQSAKARLASAFADGCTYGGASILGMFFGPMAMANREQIFRKGCNSLSQKWISGALNKPAQPEPEVEHDQQEDEE